MGIVVFIMTTDPVVWFVMFLIPSGIWLWGAMFLNPGSLPSTTHEEQWKRLMNKDMDEVKNIIALHTNINEPFYPLERRGPARFFEWISRLARRYRRTLHWLYTVVNFAILMRVIRFLGVLTVLLENVLSAKIPTFIWVIYLFIFF